MPIRWIICPVLTEAHPEGGWIRRPEVDTLIDTGLREVLNDEQVLVGRTYNWSAVIVDGQNRCLCFVRYVNPATLDAKMGTSGWMDVLGQDYEDQDLLLQKTPQELGWANNRVNQARNRIESSTGRDASTLTRTTPLWVWVAFIGDPIRSGFTPTGTYVPPIPDVLKK